MILPSFLIQLGYEAIPVVKELNSKSFIEREDHVDFIRPWSELRDIFEYLSCVEFARQRILDLPKGRYIGSVNLVPARYNSASLVFFSQAALDNFAVWLNKSHNLGLKGNNVSFYKKEIKKSLTIVDTQYGAFLDTRDTFINRLNSYRMEWLHRLAGGAEVYSNKSSADPDAEMSIMIPIDPEIPGLRGDPQRYLKRVQKIQRENGGKWLLSADEFANDITERTKDLILGLLEISAQVIK